MNIKISRIVTKYTEIECIISKLTEEKNEMWLRGDLKSKHLHKSKKSTKQ